MRTPWTIGITLAVWTTITAAQQPTANDIMTRVGAYAAAYAANGSVIAGVETHTQNFTVDGVTNLRPLKMVAELAIVRVEGGGWVGFRDVFEVNDDAVRDRKDRLQSLLTGPSASVSGAMRLAAEGARFNASPITRNFNAPTTALFFFLPQNLERFQFTKKGERTIDGVKVVEITFKETTQPTLITTRSGRNVPIDGALFVTPEGTVVRTRMHMERFADLDASPTQPTPGTPAPVNAASNNGGREAITARRGADAGMDIRPIESSAEIQVTYRKVAGLDLWLPAQMEESYDGPIVVRNRPIVGHAVTRASYADFKLLGTAGAVIPQ